METDKRADASKGRAPGSPDSVQKEIFSFSFYKYRAHKRHFVKASFQSKKFVTQQDNKIFAKKNLLCRVVVNAVRYKSDHAFLVFVVIKISR